MSAQQQDLRIIISPQEMQSTSIGWRQDGQRVAFVPTMGALHDGHIQLVEKAKTLADRVVVSIFVNPLQFGPNEDFSKYPRTLKEDAAQLVVAGVDTLFLPTAADIYPVGFQTKVVNEQIALDLDGRSRPGHFNGVLTVVNKLLNIVQPQTAVFGKKDYQQWRLIERMVRDLAMPIKIVGAETLRELDGLAMSSRNRYLDSDGRAEAVGLQKSLQAAKAKYTAGEKSVEALAAVFKDSLAASKNIELDYVALRRQDDLRTFDDAVNAPAVMLAAVKLGGVRLIDNLEF